MILRWVCKKCNKKWIFPVTKCVYCKGEILIEKSTKLKVIGFTKVYVPSPMHPIVPYNILILEDEHGNKIPKKTKKDLENIKSRLRQSTPSRSRFFRVPGPLSKMARLYPNFINIQGAFLRREGKPVPVPTNITSINKKYPALAVGAPFQGVQIR